MRPADELRAALDARCLAGLAGAARELVADDASAVCGSFAAWKHEEGRRSWPWLPGLCFSALEELGVGFPVDDDAAVTLGRVLVGAETDARRVADALATVGAGAAAQAAAPASGADLAFELRRRTLETAVDRFWKELQTAARRLHEPVVERDRPRADSIIVATRRRLEDSAVRIEQLAARVATVLPQAVAADPGRDPQQAGQAHHDTGEQAGVDALPSPAPGPLAEPETPQAEPRAEPETPRAEPLVEPETSAPAEPPADPDRPAASEPPARPDTPLAADDAGDLEATGPLELDGPDDVIPEAPGSERAPEAGSRRPGASDRPVPGWTWSGDVAADDDEVYGPADEAYGPADEAEVEYRAVRDRKLAPLVFLAGVTLGALVWLLVISGNGG